MNINDYIVRYNEYHQYNYPEVRDRIQQSEREWEKLCKKTIGKDCFICGKKIILGEYPYEVCDRDCDDESFFRKVVEDKEEKERNEWMICKQCCSIYHYDKKYNNYKEFCNNKCRAIYNEKEKICKRCGCTYKMSENELYASQYKEYCSQSCYVASIPFDKVCNKCGKKFRRIDSEHNKHCSDECYNSVPNCIVMRREAMDVSKTKEYKEWEKNLRQMKTYRCYWCGETYTHMERQMHIDHMKAIVNGGKDEWNNICVSCRECNLTKSSKDLTVWIQELADRYEHI